MRYFISDFIECIEKKQGLKTSVMKPRIVLDSGCDNWVSSDTAFYVIPDDENVYALPDEYLLVSSADDSYIQSFIDLGYVEVGEYYG